MAENHWLNVWKNWVVKVVFSIVFLTVGFLDQTGGAEAAFEFGFDS